MRRDHRPGDAPVLDGEAVPAINCRLRGAVERADPVVLVENADMSFLGSKIYGQGFTLTPAERDELVRKNKKNGERIFPYIGGEEVNTSPTQDFDRYVISFGTMPLEEAENWPDLLKIVREKVKPERDKNKRENYKEYWWRFGEGRPGLHAAIAPLKRCLVNSRVTKHLVFAFQPADRIFSEQLYAYPFDDYAHFAALQSRIHEPWARLLSSSMRNDLRYASSDCFETFPFPPPAALTMTSPLERTGKALYETRTAYMVRTQQGLTQTYNKLKDPACTDAPVIELRRLHDAMDRAVLDGYGWTDLVVPPYGTPVTAEDRRTLERFQDTVIDRLFALNDEPMQPGPAREESQDPMPSLTPSTVQ